MISPTLFHWAPVAGFCALLSGCGPHFDDMAEGRTAYAEAGDGPVVVAVVDDRPDGGYLDGVRLGAAQINASEGRLLGRPLQLLERQGRDDFGAMLSTIRSIAADPRVTAILGHRTSAVAVPASITYEKAHVLFMPPFATSERLTLHGFDFVLRMLPSDKVMTAQIASVAGLFGYQRIAVLHDRSESSRAVAFLFEDAARRFDVDIAFQGSFFTRNDDYHKLISRLKGVEFDAIFLSTDTRAGARMLRQLRGQGIDKPVLGSHALGAGPLIKLAGVAGDRTIVPTVFSPEAKGDRQRRFIRAYRDTYGKAPDQAAAQGFDSINILAALVKRSDSTTPRALATTAHFSGPLAGITGIYAYDPAGNLYGKSYRFEVLRFGRRWPLPGVTLPYHLAAFRDVLAPIKRPAQQPPPHAASPRPDTGTALPPPESDPMPSAAPDGSKRRTLRADRRQAALDGTSVHADGETLAALTRGYPGLDERDQAWLALAHEMLGFKRLGLVVSPARPHDTALLELARSVGRKRGFEVLECALPARSSADEGREAPSAATRGGTASGRVRSSLESAALRCYSRLAPAVDSLFVVTDVGLPASYLQRLDRALLHFGVSTFTFQEHPGPDYGLTLALVGPSLGLGDPAVALRFDGLLNGIRVHELNQKLSHLPWIAVDLEAARSLGLFTDPRELSPISGVLDSSSTQPALSLGGETN